MSTRCTVCQHDQRRDIDRALVAGRPVLVLARTFSVGRMALVNHQAVHLPQKLAKAQKAAEVAQADDLLGELISLKARAISLMDKAENAGDLRTALRGVAESRACLELLLQVTQRISAQPTPAAFSDECEVPSLSTLTEAPWVAELPLLIERQGITEEALDRQRAERLAQHLAMPDYAIRRMAAQAAIRQLRSTVIARDGYICGLCGGLCAPDELSIDHVQPVFLGGSDELENLQVAHRSCNSAKGARFISPPPVTIQKRRTA